MKQASMPSGDSFLKVFQQMLQSVLAKQANHILDLSVHITEQDCVQTECTPDCVQTHTCTGFTLRSSCLMEVLSGLSIEACARYQTLPLSLSLALSLSLSFICASQAVTCITDTARFD